MVLKRKPSGMEGLIVAAIQAVAPIVAKKLCSKMKQMKVKTSKTKTKKKETKKDAK